MDEADCLQQQLLAGDISYPELFHLLVQREPRLGSVRLDDIEPVDAADVPKRRPVVETVVRGVLGIPLRTNMASARKRLRPKAAREWREHQLLLHSVRRYVSGLVGEAGVLRERLFRGEVTHGEIFEILVAREPRLDVHSMTDVEGVAAGVAAP